MLNEAKVASFRDVDRANRTVRWLRRSGLHARTNQVGQAFEVVVPSGPEEREARQVLQALERSHEWAEPAKQEEALRSRLLNPESVGTLAFVVGGGALLLIVGIGLWALVGLIGWLALIVVGVAALVFFHFSGIPHSAVKSPRPYSHKHDITLGEEQEVQYRLAWARDQYRRSRQQWPFRRRHPKQ